MSTGRIPGLHTAYRSGDADPAAQVERFLAASPVGGDIDAFVSVDPQGLRDGAAAAQGWRGRQRVRPLQGVLVGVKDFIHVAGHATRAGTSWLVEEPAADAALVRRLRESGAMIAGKTRMTELGLSPVGVNVSDRSPRNPHDLARATGGSSSGSAAAVAAGLVPLAIGSDGGGSLRAPPALCGVYGLKPTFGRVEVGGELRTGWWSLAVAGPIAGTVTDLAIGWSVLSGEPTVDLQAQLEVRVGVDWSWWGVPDSAVDRVCRAAVAELDPTIVTLEHLELAQPAGYVTALAEVAAAMDVATRDGLERFGPDVELQLTAATALSAVDFVRAQQARTLLASSFAEAFGRVDVLVVPTTATTAPALPPRVWDDGLVDEGLIRRLTVYAFPANLVGLPALALPVGVDGDGMPVSLQLIGRHGEEATLLRLAARLERSGIASAPRPVRWHGDP